MAGGRRCPECGAQNPVDARFCNQCATALTDATLAPAAGPREERRQITVLFSDAAGYTKMAETLDPELVRELMGVVYEKADAVVRKYGGRVDKLMGDAVLAVFGDPVTHEDDAERAVRAALELHAAIDDMRPDFERRTGHSFSMHSGLNTGVVVTSDLDDDRMSGPLGDMVNVAARLQSLAGSGEIMIGPETCALLRGRFAVTDLGLRELKGRREPVRVARIDGPMNRVGMPSRRTSLFVGRETELGVLMAAFEAVCNGSPAVIALSGEAGSGKTRLLEELHGRLAPDVQWFEGRAYPYTSNIPYAPVIDLLNRTADVTEQDDADAVRTKLEALVDRSLPGDTEVMVALAHLYGLDREHADDSAYVDLESFQSVLRNALVSLIDVAADRVPTVVCLQDLHWVDPSTMDLVRELPIAVSAPVLTIINYRPGVSVHVPGAQQIHLEELSPAQIVEQLQSLLGGGTPPGELVELVSDRTDGNPFFVEEIVNSLLETALLTREDTGWVLRPDVASAAVPTTIRGLISARIDNLEPNRRRVLREGSVIGREFLYRLVRNIATCPDELDADLAALTEADLIRQKLNDVELEYIFKHALTQEVAYDGLLRRERQEIHFRIAQAIERHLADRIGEFVESLAYHYERSGRAVEATHYLRRAGRKALDRYAIREAHLHYASAYALLTSADDERSVDAADRARLLLELILDWAHAYYYTAEFGDLHRLQTLHADLPDRVGDDRLTARWMAWAGHVALLHLSQPDHSVRLLDDALALATACDDPTAQSYALAWLTWSLYIAGDTERAVALGPPIEDVLARVSDAHDQRYGRIKAIGGIAIAAGVRGDMELARRSAATLLDIGAASGNRRAAAIGHVGLGNVHVLLGDEARALAEMELAVASDADPVYAVLARNWSIAGRMVLGNPLDARDTIASLRGVTAENELHLFSDFLDSYSAMVQIAAGDLSRGMRELAAVRDAAGRRGDRLTCVVVDLFVAVLYARIATGEASGSVTAALRNPGFVVRHARGAARRGRTALLELAGTVEDRGFGGLRPSIHFELAKLARHERRLDDARAHLAAVRVLLCDEPAATLAMEAAALDASLT